MAICFLGFFFLFLKEFLVYCPVDVITVNISMIKSDSSEGRPRMGKPAALLHIRAVSAAREGCGSVFTLSH